MAPCFVQLFRALFLHNWLRPKCPGTHEGTDYSKRVVHNQLGMVRNQLGYASGQCHKRREGGMCPSERHSGDTEFLSQSLEMWGQARVDMGGGGREAGQQTSQ